MLLTKKFQKCFNIIQIETFASKLLKIVWMLIYLVIFEL